MLWVVVHEEHDKSPFLWVLPKRLVRRQHLTAAIHEQVVLIVVVVVVVSNVDKDKQMVGRGPRLQAKWKTGRSLEDLKCVVSISRKFILRRHAAAWI